MSRNFIPAVLAIGIGVFTGYYTFQPTFQQLAIEKAQGGQSPASSNTGNAPAEGSNTTPAKPLPTESRSDGDKSK